MKHRIAVLDDVLEAANILAAPLRMAGYEVLTDLTVVDFERVLNFKPELIVLGLHRRIRAYNRPFQSLEQDLYGYEPMVDMERYPAINVIPLLVLSTGVQESDMPTALNYDGFIIIPEDAPAYLPMVKTLIETVKTRRLISAYLCPNCGSRLTYTLKPAKDLFCPRCHTGVVIVDAERVLITEAGALTSRTGPVTLLRAHEGETSAQAETRATDHKAK